MKGERDAASKSALTIFTCGTEKSAGRKLYFCRRKTENNMEK